jgi:nucleoside-diphosphate-sugar epimerase
VGPVLVTGAAGFLGRHLVAALVAEGSPTVALCRRPAALADLSHPELSIASGDVRDAAICARLLAGVDTVVHLAAVRNRPGSSLDEMASVNEEATVRLARQAADAGVGRFVHLATAQVFGPSELPLDETAPLVPERAGSFYAASKARAVLGLRELVREGVPVVTLFPTIVYGPDHPSRPNRVTSHVRGLLRRRFDVVLGSGEARRDLVHVADVVRATLAAARQPGAAGEELLVAGEAVSPRGFGELVARCAGQRPPLVVSVPLRLGSVVARSLDRGLGYDPRCGVASAVDTLVRGWSFRGDRARAVLDHEPRPLARGIAETVAWIRGGQGR